jgi:hypothetical protein
VRSKKAFQQRGGIKESIKAFAEIAIEIGASRIQLGANVIRSK